MVDGGIDGATLSAWWRERWDYHDDRVGLRNARLAKPCSKGPNCPGCRQERYNLKCEIKNVKWHLSLVHDAIASRGTLCGRDCEHVLAGIGAQRLASIVSRIESNLEDALNYRPGNQPQWVEDEIYELRKALKFFTSPFEASGAASSKPKPSKTKPDSAPQKRSSRTTATEDTMNSQTKLLEMRAKFLAKLAERGVRPATSSTFKASLKRDWQRMQLHSPPDSDETENTPESPSETNSPSSKQEPSKTKKDSTNPSSSRPSPSSESGGDLYEQILSSLEQEGEEVVSSMSELKASLKKEWQRTRLDSPLDSDEAEDTPESPAPTEGEQEMPVVAEELPNTPHSTGGSEPTPHSFSGWPSRGEVNRYERGRLVSESFNLLVLGPVGFVALLGLKFFWRIPAEGLVVYVVLALPLIWLLRCLLRAIDRARGLGYLLPLLGTGSLLDAQASLLGFLTLCLVGFLADSSRLSEPDSWAMAIGAMAASGATWAAARLVNIAECDRYGLMELANTNPALFARWHSTMIGSTQPSRTKWLDIRAGTLGGYQQAFEDALRRLPSEVLERLRTSGDEDAELQACEAAYSVAERTGAVWAHLPEHLRMSLRGRCNKTTLLSLLLAFAALPAEEQQEELKCWVAAIVTRSDRAQLQAAAAPRAGLLMKNYFGRRVEYLSRRGKQ